MNRCMLKACAHKNCMFIKNKKMYYVAQSNVDTNCIDSLKNSTPCIALA